MPHIPPKKSKKLPFSKQQTISCVYSTVQSRQESVQRMGYGPREEIPGRETFMACKQASKKGSEQVLVAHWDGKWEGGGGRRIESGGGGKRAPLYCILLYTTDLVQYLAASSFIMRRRRKKRRRRIFFRKNSRNPFLQAAWVGVCVLIRMCDVYRHTRAHKKVTILYVLHTCRTCMQCTSH